MQELLAIQVSDGFALSTGIWKELGQGNTKDEICLIS